MFGISDSTDKNDSSTSIASSTGEKTILPLQTSVPVVGSTNSSLVTGIDAAPPIGAPPETEYDSTPAAPTAAPSAYSGISDANPDDAYTSVPPQANQLPGIGSSPSQPSQPAVAPPPPISNASELINIKQQALQSLAPLVGHLEQTDEEKFKTTMMLIQASDNSSLLTEAYATANKITDEKVRAQALLDVVNEINYFTQHHSQ